MKDDKERFRDMVHMCCAPRTSHGREGFLLTIGIMSILTGLIWFGARMEWITWIHAVPFWPVMITVCGIWMVCRGLKTRKSVHSTHRKEG
jgi:hypothetical protein